MNQEIIEKINLFEKKLRTDRLNKANNHENEIIDYYLQLLEDLVTDYQAYSEYFPLLLASIENNDAKTYSIFIFFQLYEQIFEPCNISELDIVQFDENISEATLNKFFNQLKKCLASEKPIRISEYYFSIEDFTEQEIKECISHLCDFFQINSETIEWSDEQVENHIIYLAVIKSLLRSNGNNEYFYFVVSMFFDRLNTTELFQAARDVAEEVIIASFNDTVPELGFLNAFHCYSRQKNINAAILYANMTLFVILTSEKPLLNKLAQEIIWESIRYFRNVKIAPYAVKLYKSIPREVSFSDYERRAIDNAYFSSLIEIQDQTLPNQILNYLHKEREGIIKAGSKEAFSWLLILHNIKRLYPDTDFSETNLGFYLNTFDSMVPKEISKKFISIIHGNSKDLKDYLKLSLLRLNETRNINDLAHDNDKALTIANRLIGSSFANGDDEAILLAMMIKSDFSLIFQSKGSDKLRPFILQKNDLDHFKTIHGDYVKIPEKLSNSKSELIIWLAVTEGKVFQLSLANGDFHFSSLKSFNWDVFHNLKLSNYFSNLTFIDEIKDYFGIREVTQEEYHTQSKEIQKSLHFSRLLNTEEATSILIVKDMDLAMFPHNLMLDEHGNFIHFQKPITNILSTEWFLACKDDSIISNNFSKSIWIPTKDGDLTLNKLYDSLKPELIKHEFNIHETIDLSTPISTELNVICSHGAQDIASQQVIFSGERYLENLEKIVGPGKILIFFVCHSGSYNNEYFRNNITSIVKTYISLGYKAVVAPFWSLHVEIPKIWLGYFMNSLNEGLTISNALFKANESLCKKYPTPTAWACMHLYGNPYLTTEKSK